MSDITYEAKSVQHAGAIEYAKRGIPVFPIIRRGSTPLPGWSEKATTDMEQINEWWSKIPEYNIGIQTGEKSGIVVIDFATPEAWRIGQEKGLIETPIAQAGIGYQVYCRHQDGLEDYRMRSDCPGIDLRGNRRFAIVPPSVIAPQSFIEKEVIYSWVDGKGLDGLELGNVPEWLLERTEDDEPTLVGDGGNLDVVDTQHVNSEAQEEMQDTEAVEVLTLLDTKKASTPIGIEVLPTIVAVGEKGRET